jgi:hypothetical protein
MLESTQRNIDRTLLWMGVSLLAAASLTGLGAAWLYTTAQFSTPVRQSVIVPSHAAPPMKGGFNNVPVPTWFDQFALNALVAPLIDDAEPAMWTDVALDFMCDPSTRVLVDGKPMVSGSPLPTQPFSIRWDMNHCEPLGPGTPLSGGVELLVSYDSAGLIAQVVPDRLQIHGPKGASSLVSPFTARLSLVRSSFDP